MTVTMAKSREKDNNKTRTERKKTHLGPKRRLGPFSSPATPAGSWWLWSVVVLFFLLLLLWLLLWWLSDVGWLEAVDRDSVVTDQQSHVTLRSRDFNQDL